LIPFLSFFASFSSCLTILCNNDNQDDANNNNCSNNNKQQAAAPANQRAVDCVIGRCRHRLVPLRPSILSPSVLFCLPICLSAFA
jgi:hypothetical protein